MSKIYKILGKRGRITIPFEIRLRKGFAYNDVVSFEEKDDNTVVIKREKICDKCKVSAAIEKKLLFLISSTVFSSLSRRLFLSTSQESLLTRRNSDACRVIPQFFLRS